MVIIGEEEEDPKPELWKDRWERLKFQQEVILEEGRRVDKAVLTIASGAIIASITFCSALHGIVGQWILILSWGGLLLSIIVNILGMYFLNNAAVAQVEVYRTECERPVNQEAKAKWQHRFTRCANRANFYGATSIIALTAGLVALAAFAYLNIANLVKP